LAFKIKIAEGINNFLKRFFLASGTLRQMELSEKRMGEIVQYLSGFPFKCSSIYILDRCICLLWINLLAVLTTQAAEQVKDLPHLDMLW